MEPKNSSEPKQDNQAPATALTPAPAPAPAPSNWSYWDYVPFSSWLSSAPAPVQAAAAQAAKAQATAQAAAEPAHAQPESGASSTTTTTTTTFFTTTTTTTTSSAGFRSEAEGHGHEGHVLEGVALPVAAVEEPVKAIEEPAAQAVEEPVVVAAEEPAAAFAEAQAGEPAAEVPLNTVFEVEEPAPAVEEEPRAPSPSPFATASSPRAKSPVQEIEMREISPSLGTILESASEPDFAEASAYAEAPAEMSSDRPAADIPDEAIEEEAPIPRVDSPVMELRERVSRAPRVQKERVATPMPAPLPSAEWFDPPRWEEHVNLENPIPLRIIDDTPPSPPRPSSAPAQSVPALVRSGSLESRMASAYSRLKPEPRPEPKPEPKPESKAKKAEKSEKSDKLGKASTPIPIPKSKAKPKPRHVEIEEEDERDEYIPPSLLFKYGDHPQKSGVVRNLSRGQRANKRNKRKKERVRV